MYALLAIAPFVVIASASSYVLNMSPPATSPGAIWGDVRGITEVIIVIGLYLLALYIRLIDKERRMNKLTYINIAIVAASGVVPLAFSTANAYVLASLPLYVLLTYDSLKGEKTRLQTGTTAAQVETLTNIVNLFVEYVSEDEMKRELESLKGYEEYIDWARNVARDFVTAEKKKLDLGRGVLLYGPPGTGKTALAMVIAYFVLQERRNNGLEEGVVVRLTPKILSKYYGEAEQFVHALFDFAIKKHAIIIADEVERYIWRRQMFVSDDITPKVVATFLEALDNPKIRAAPVLFVATTNSPLLADEAFFRSGRFYKVLEVGLPDVAAIRRIISGFESTYNITLTEQERIELIRLSGITGDEIRYYFTCRSLGRDHQYCINDIKRIVELRNKIRGQLRHEEMERMIA
jgi:SpoVK/Ycf46/Vps4 family AAA+-type ATPase